LTMTTKMTAVVFMLVFLSSIQFKTVAACSSKSQLSASELKCVFPRLSSSKAATYAETMSSMLGGSILSNTCHWAAFLGNVGTESAELTEWTQIPCNSGDDAPYCGRGPLQITGSSNYNYCARQGICGCSGIGSDPQEVSNNVRTGFGTAKCVWGIMSGHDLSSNADGSQSGFLATACYINAGHSPCGTPNGWYSRLGYWKKANECLSGGGHSPAPRHHPSPSPPRPGPSPPSNACCECIENAGGRACASKCESKGSTCTTCIKDSGGKACGSRCGCNNNNYQYYNANAEKADAAPAYTTPIILTTVGVVAVLVVVAVVVTMMLKRAHARAEVETNLSNDEEKQYGTST